MFVVFFNKSSLTCCKMYKIVTKCTPNLTFSACNLQVFFWEGHPCAHLSPFGSCSTSVFTSSVLHLLTPTVPHPSNLTPPVDTALEIRFWQQDSFYPVVAILSEFYQSCIIWELLIDMLTSLCKRISPKLMRCYEKMLLRV